MNVLKFEYNNHIVEIEEDHPANTVYTYALWVDGTEIDTLSFSSDSTSRIELKLRAINQVKELIDAMHRRPDEIPF